MDENRVPSCKLEASTPSTKSCRPALFYPRRCQACQGLSRMFPNISLTYRTPELSSWQHMCLAKKQNAKTNRTLAGDTARVITLERNIRAQSARLRLMGNGWIYFFLKGNGVHLDDMQGWCTVQSLHFVLIVGPCEYRSSSASSMLIFDSSPMAFLVNEIYELVNYCLELVKYFYSRSWKIEQIQALLHSDESGHNPASICEIFAPKAYRVRCPVGCYMVFDFLFTTHCVLSWLPLKHSQSLWKQHREVKKYKLCTLLNIEKYDLTRAPLRNFGALK